MGLQSTLLPFVVPMILMCLGRLGLLGRLPIFMATWRVQAVGYPLGTLVIGLSEWALWMQDTLAATVVFVEH